MHLFLTFKVQILATDEGTSTMEEDDTAPLFYRPSKSGYYTPIAGKNSTHRLNAFRNVGRYQRFSFVIIVTYKSKD